jgi:hypothetical protein
MTIERKAFPYEFLVRWDKGGRISGQHIQYRELVVDDGEVIAERLGRAFPVIEDGDFPLSDILSELQISQARTISELTKLIEELNDQLADERTARRLIEDKISDINT